MREAMFIKKNAGKWKAYQQERSPNPDETAERFITLIDDLSYAKTFYPRSKVTRWINGIAASIYQNIYRSKRERYSRIFDFWKYELPLLFKKYHKVFLFTTLLFVLFVLIGYFSSQQNPEFVRGIMGDQYMNMTEDNIAKGDPFGVYKDENQFSMFVRIAYNNIKVSFITFLGGFTGGLITLKFMWSTGIMVGSFHEVFASHGMGLRSVLVIWIHGTIELWSIVIAGTAGFILGGSLLFPGTFTRLESFKRGVKDAAKILISLIPFFIIAAFLESYITHLMSRTYERGVAGGMPPWLSIIILAGSLFLIIYYFVILPRRLHKKGFFIKYDGIVSRLKSENA